MKKLGLLFIVAGIFMFSCAEQPKEQVDETFEAVTVAELYENTLKLDGSVVQFEGVLIHTCRTSGDKMHIADKENEKYRVRVNLGDYTGKIGPEEEGRDISVTGTLVVTEIPEGLKEKAECEHETHEDCDYETHEDCDHEEAEAHDHDHDCEHDAALKELQREVIIFHIDLISFEWL